MGQRHRSSCEVSLYRTLNSDRLGCWFPEGSHAPRSKIDSCSWLRERHRRSGLPEIEEDRLRTCAGRAHQILCWIIMNCVSSQGSYGPWSNPAITLTKPLLLVPCARITMQLSDLILSRHHHVGSSGTKVVRPCRRFLQPNSEELKTNLSIWFPRADKVAVDQQLQSFIVDSHPLVAISDRSRFSDVSTARSPQDFHSDEIVD